ncbi:hypothetical protein G6F56_009348 [Rhizopus delemar]|nr:hypothetical protein G6F56_009348 [Rhizopus delemar]
MPVLRYTSGDSSIHSSTSSTTTMISQSSLSSILSSSDEENEQITAVSGRKLTVPVKVIIQNDKDQYNLYEDIWMDSPIIREYLSTLENWLLQYLTWLEKVQQCRQLEIAYNKAISLLHEQTKLVLSQPFYTSEECEKLHWLDKEEEDMCDNEEIGNILSDLTEHGKDIKDTLECNGERLSHYISQKSASYYRFLNSKDDHLYISGSSDIPFSNTPKIIPKYNSIELLFTQQSLIIHQMSTRGYLLMKRNSKDTTPNYTGKWERHYFYISKNDGHLKQYKNQSVSVTLANLKHAVIQALESEKRSYVIQISLARDDFW